MTPLILLAGGLLALAAAALLLRSYGPRYRVARLLATAPAVSLVDALSAAAAASEVPAGAAPYLRVDGRVDSETSFEDDARRPLVFRRTRLQARSRGRWATFEDLREEVPFEVGDGLRAIGVDTAALGDGLVVLPRESIGRAGDVPDRVPRDMAPTTPVRALVEQVSAVEHATVVGVPVLGPDGAVRITAGRGRPLVLSTLEMSEAMRVLGGGRRGRATLIAAALVAGVAQLAAGLGWLLVAALTGAGW